MSHTPHELAEEFPNHVERLQELKASDAHFARAVEDYHKINRAVHRAETDLDPVDDLTMTDMRKQRMVLKDRIWKSLSAQ